MASLESIKNQSGCFKHLARLVLVISLSACNSVPIDSNNIATWTEQEMLSVSDLNQLGDGKMQISEDGTSLVGGKKVPREFILGKWHGQNDPSKQVFIDKKIWNTLSIEDKVKAGQMSPLKVQEKLRLLATSRLNPQISTKLNPQAVVVVPRTGYWECWWIFCWWVEPSPPPPPPPPPEEEEYILVPTGSYSLSAPDGLSLESGIPSQNKNTDRLFTQQLKRYVNVWGSMSQSTSYQFDCSTTPISGSSTTWIQGTASSSAEQLLSRIYTTSSVRRNAVTASGNQLYPFTAVATTRGDSGGSTTSQEAVARFESTCYGFKAFTEPGYGLVTRNYRSIGWHSFVPPKGAILSFYTQSPTW